MSGAILDNADLTDANLLNADLHEASAQSADFTRAKLRMVNATHLDASGAVYLDTQESRGLVPGSHASFVGAMRAAAMALASKAMLT